MPSRSPTSRRKASPKFSTGEKVKAKWPGSNLYFDAEVKEVHDGKTFTYTVLFDGDYEDILPETSLAGVRYFRSRSSSPGHKNKRSSRSRSPGRGRKRRSPSPSPARKSKPKSSPSPRRRQSRKRVDDTPPSSPEQTPRRSLRSRKTPQIVEVKEEEIAVTRTEQKRQVITEEASTSIKFVHMTRSQAKKLATQTVVVEAPAKEKPTAYEFGGPIGVFIMIHVLPAIPIVLYLFCNKNQCAIKQNPKLPPWTEYFDLTAFLVVLGCIHFMAILYAIPIGKVATGFPLADGSCLQYRINGFLSLVLSLCVFGAGVYYKKIPVEYVYDKYLALMTSSIILAFLFGIALYLKAQLEKTDLSPSGNTESGLYNFFVGQQLNPRKFGIDLKMFFFRTGLIGWIMVNLCMVLKVYKESHILPVPLVLVCSFQFICCLDALWFEETVLSTGVIIYEAVGFMTSVAVLSWIPFLYSLQSRFLVDHPEVQLSNSAVVGIVVLNVLGYIIYRGANSQKYRFRRDPGHPDFADAVTIETSSGKRLLVSGCWGIVRHPNYLGDILMGFSWSLACGFTHAIPYFYPFYLVLMLIDRVNRDEASCAQRYGESWNDYCRRVPFKIIPKVF